MWQNQTSSSVVRGCCHHSLQILKDIRNRFEVLRGRQVHYVPGWDCHGLPIELKALGGLCASGLTPLQIRQRGETPVTVTGSSSGS